MAAIYSEELFPGRESRDGIQRLLKHTRVFEVRTSDPQDDGVTAGAEASLPRNGDPHPNDPNRVMVDIHAVNSDEDPTLWKVTCFYDSDLPVDQAREVGTYDPATGESIPGGDTGNGGSAGERADNPLDRPVRLSFEWEQAQEIATTTLLANPIVASNGLPFDPPPMKDVAYQIITAVKNYPIGDARLTLSEVNSYVNAVNDNTWASFPANTARIIGASMVYDSENGVPFAQISWRIKIKPDNWYLKPVDQGYYILTAGDLFEIETLEGSGKSTGKPRLLDGSGDLLPPGDPAVFLEFEVYESKNFSALDI